MYNQIKFGSLIIGFKFQGPDYKMSVSTPLIPRAHAFELKILIFMKSQYLHFKIFFNLQKLDFYYLDVRNIDIVKLNLKKIINRHI